MAHFLFKNIYSPISMKLWKNFIVKKWENEMLLPICFLDNNILKLMHYFSYYSSFLGDAHECKNFLSHPSLFFYGNIFSLFSHGILYTRNAHIITFVKCIIQLIAFLKKHFPSHLIYSPLHWVEKVNVCTLWFLLTFLRHNKLIKSSKSFTL